MKCLETIITMNSNEENTYWKEQKNLIQNIINITRSLNMEQDEFIKHLKKRIFEEVSDAEPIVVGEEILTDGTEGVYLGRYELGNSLLAEFDKWGF